MTGQSANSATTAVEYHDRLLLEENRVRTDIILSLPETSRLIGSHSAMLLLGAGRDWTGET
jgi:hypothetical protein